MSLTLPKTAADFETQLAAPVAVSNTTATLASIQDDDGINLADGVYGFTIDLNSSAKEFIIATLSGTSLTNIVSISRQGASSSGFARAHRRGAKVVITDWAVLSRILNNIDGTTGFNSLVKLGYDADPAINSGDVTKFATVKFVNDTAIAGGVDATTTVKGITKLSSAPVSPTDPIAVGDTDTRIPTQSENDALAGTSGTPSDTNRYVTNDDVAETKTASKIARRDSNGDVLVSTTPTSSDAATSKSYVDNAILNKTNKVHLSSAAITISPNDGSENTIVSFTVPAGTLGTANAIKFKSYISNIDTSNTVQDFILRVKYGGTTLLTFTINGNFFAGSSANLTLGYFEGVIYANASASAQYNTGYFNAQSATGNTQQARVKKSSSSSTVDSSTSQTFSITAQANTALQNFTIDGLTVELIS